jgi:hypothetical protein
MSYPMGGGMYPGMSDTDLLRMSTNATVQSALGTSPNPAPPMFGGNPPNPSSMPSFGNQLGMPPGSAMPPESPQSFGGAQLPASEEKGLGSKIKEEIESNPGTTAIGCFGALAAVVGGGYAWNKSREKVADTPDPKEEPNKSPNAENKPAATDHNVTPKPEKQKKPGWFSRAGATLKKPFQSSSPKLPEEQRPLLSNRTTKWPKLKPGGKFAALSSMGSTFTSMFSKMKPKKLFSGRHNGNQYSRLSEPPTGSGPQQRVSPPSRSRSREDVESAPPYTAKPSAQERILDKGVSPPIYTESENILDSPIPPNLQTPLTPKQAGHPSSSWGSNNPYLSQVGESSGNHHAIKNEPVPFHPPADWVTFP